MRLVEHNAWDHGAQHASQHNAQPYATRIDLMTWIILEHHLYNKSYFNYASHRTQVLLYRIEQRWDGIEDAHIDAIGEQQKYEIPIGQQILQRLPKADLLLAQALQTIRCLLSGRRRRWRLILKDCNTIWVLSLARLDYRLYLHMAMSMSNMLVSPATR